MIKIHGMAYKPTPSSSTAYTTMQYTPAKLVFGRDSIINQCHDIDWDIIRKRKQQLINKGNKCENRN